jgi:hypothetical protein
MKAGGKPIPCTLLGLFDPGDGGNVFLQNIGWLSTDYTALYPNRWYSSKLLELSASEFTV